MGQAGGVAGADIGLSVKPMPTASLATTRVAGGSPEALAGRGAVAGGAGCGGAQRPSGIPFRCLAGLG